MLVAVNVHVVVPLVGEALDSPGSVLRMVVNDCQVIRMNHEG